MLNRRILLKIPLIAKYFSGLRVTSVPVTVLSGFLGAGKTTFLQEVLKNEKKELIGLVVNDVASINVDAKMIRQQTVDSLDGIDTLELQNGCVCCNLAEDFLSSITKLITVAESKGRTYDHIIVECSGIAEPRKIREIFRTAEEDFSNELYGRVRLDTLITLLDAASFFKIFGSGKKNYFDDESGDSKSASQDNDQKGVDELILEQIECADIVVMNKCDLLEDKSTLQISEQVFVVFYS
jgi:G3E family GTPase